MRKTQTNSTFYFCHLSHVKNSMRKETCRDRASSVIKLGFRPSNRSVKPECLFFHVRVMIPVNVTEHSHMCLVPDQCTVCKDTHSWVTVVWQSADKSGWIPERHSGQRAFFWLSPPLLCFHKLSDPMPGSQGLNPNWQASGWYFETWLTELASFLRLRHKLILLILQRCCHVQSLSIFMLRLLIWESVAAVPCWKWKESVFNTKSMWLWYKDDTPQFTLDIQSREARSPSCTFEIGMIKVPQYCMSLLWISIVSCLSNQFTLKEFTRKWNSVQTYYKRSDNA